LGRRPLGAVLSSNELGELSQWLYHDDSTINIVLELLFLFLKIHYYYYLLLLLSLEMIKIVSGQRSLFIVDHPPSMKHTNFVVVLASKQVLWSLTSEK